MYDAEGTRLQTTYYTPKVTMTVPPFSVLTSTDNLQNYNILSYAMVGNKRYIRNGHGSWQLQDVLNPEGYTRYYGPEEHYRFYYIKDHRGNIRETYINPYPGYKVCVQRTQYYPTGLPWNEGMSPSEQPFKYNGKEFVEMHGLDEYDSEARWYYPAIMRTTTMDPLCEKYYSISPYAWCGNNPVNLVDPDGRETKIYLNPSDSRYPDALEFQKKDKSNILTIIAHGEKDAISVFSPLLEGNILQPAKYVVDDIVANSDVWKDKTITNKIIVLNACETGAESNNLARNCSRSLKQKLDQQNTDTGISGDVYVIAPVTPIPDDKEQEKHLWHIYKNGEIVTNSVGTQEFWFNGTPTEEIIRQKIKEHEESGK